MLNKIINFKEWLDTEFTKYQDRAEFVRGGLSALNQINKNPNSEEYCKWMGKVLTDELVQEFKKDLKDYLEKNNLL